MPGGAPCAFTNYSVAADFSLRDRKHGSTLPGRALSSAARVSNQASFVPFISSDDEETPTLPPRSSSVLSKRDSHKLPVPEPRLSIIHTTPIKGSKTTSRDIEDNSSMQTTPNKESSLSSPGTDGDENNSSYLTLVTDITGSPSFLKHTLSPSMLEESNSSKVADTTGSFSESDTLVDSSGVDTPLKNSRNPTNETELDWSPNTPERNIRN